MAEPVLERPPLMPPTSTDTNGLILWANTFTQLLAQVFQQYGYRLNLSITTDGTTRMRAPMPLAHFTTAEIPNAEQWPGCVIYVTDGAAGSRFRGSDGTNWVNLG